MAHRVDSIGPGKVRVTVDLNDASLDYDEDASAARFLTLKNVVIDRPGPVRKRGSFAYATAATTGDGFTTAPVVGSLGATYFAQGQDADLKARAQAQTYNGGTTYDLGILDDAYSGGSGTVYGFYMPRSPLADLGDVLVSGGSSSDTIAASNDPTIITQWSGATQTVYSTGTISATNGGTSVTGSGTSWTGSMKNAYLIATGDSGSASTRMAYRIKSVTSGTALELHEPYAGSTAAGKTYRIISFAGVHGSTGVWTSDGWVRAMHVASYGRRLFVGNVRETSTSGLRNANRIRWSGLLGSTEGSGALIGIHGWDASGYLDLRQGDIRQLVSTRDSLVVLSEQGITRIHGQPTFASAGTMDASEEWDGFSGSWAGACDTPRGVYFVDRSSHGLYVLAPGSGPRQVGGRALQEFLYDTFAGSAARVCVGHYRDQLFISSHALAGGAILDMATERFVEVTGTGTQLGYPTRGVVLPGSAKHYLVGVNSSLRVVNMANAIDEPGDAATDANGGAITVDVKTGKIGSSLGTLRPYRAWVTYRATDLSTTNPYLALTVNTGLPDTSDSGHTFTSASTDFPETTDVETKRVEINVGGDPMVQVRALQTNAAGKFDLYSLVIDCYDEGEAVSS